MTRFGRPVPAAARSRQRRMSASPPSMHASLEPVVEQPVARAARRSCHSSASMLTQRRSSSAVCGYSSLSTRLRSTARVDQRARLGLHPRRHEGREVQPRVAVEHQLVVDELVGDAGDGRVLGQAQPREGLQGEVRGELRTGPPGTRLRSLARARGAGACRKLADRPDQREQRLGRGALERLPADVVLADLLVGARSAAQAEQPLGVEQVGHDRDVDDEGEDLQRRQPVGQLVDLERAAARP